VDAETKEPELQPRQIRDPVASLLWYAPLKKGGTPFVPRSPNNRRRSRQHSTSDQECDAWFSEMKPNYVYAEPDLHSEIVNMLEGFYLQKI
jgi:hypothetical protein